MPTATAVSSLGKFDRHTAGSENTAQATPAPAPQGSHLVRYAPEGGDETKVRPEEQREFFSYDDAAEFARTLVKCCSARPDTISIYEKMSVEVTVGVQPFARPAATPDRIR